MSTLLQALWPLFALIVVGQCLRRRHTFLSLNFWAEADRLNYFILFPALLFSHLARAPLQDPALPSLASCALVSLALGWGVLLLARRRYAWPAARFGVFTQATLRFNTFLGLAVTANLFGQAGLDSAALVLALLIPALNLLSVWALSAHHDSNWRSLLFALLKNPLILACLAGLLVNVSGLNLTGGTAQLIKLLAAASLPLGLLCVGAALDLSTLHQEHSALLHSAMLRLLGMPLLAGTVAFAWGLPPMETCILTLFFALPTAPTAYALTRQLAGDTQLMAGIISTQTLLAALSLPLILALLT